jgi:hypothetical protein
VSLLWADQLSILMCPDRLLVAHRPRGRRAESMETTVVPLPPASGGAAQWEPAAAKLEALLAATPEWRGAALRIILSNHFVRYALVPWSDQLSDEQEHRLFATRQFVSAHGAVAKKWAIRLSLDRPGASHVASALDQPLLDRITLAARANRLKLTSVEPLLMAAFNRWQQDFREEAQWFVTVEDGMLCGALVGRDRWLALRRWRTQADWTSELPLWVSREQLIGDEAALAGAVYVLAPPYERSALTGMDIPVRFLGGHDPLGAVNGTDGAYAQAVEEADHFTCIL